MNPQNRIVLVSSQGDELFSGASMLALPDDTSTDDDEVTTIRTKAAAGPVVSSFIPHEPTDAAENEFEDEPAPETLRSYVHEGASPVSDRPIRVYDGAPQDDPELCV